ncbi:potassium channel family protein [Bacillus sp. 2205SS5-2]|uniref:potassium channel family protein n=1 Tax=Bacillus sp. 2205SS5-2 TaxID=3109031 RepID=UPI003003F7FD
MLKKRLIDKEKKTMIRRKRYRHLGNSFLIMNGIILIGSVGFMYFEQLSFFDSLWLTMVTVLTVGYGDQIPQTFQGKIFALVIIPIAIGVVTYAMGSIATLLLEGEFSQTVRLKRMKTKIKQLENHIIVCGVGRVGEQVLAHMRKKEIQAVYIDQDADRLDAIMDSHEIYLVGDATDDDLLIHAGIKKAAGLISTFPSDADNVFVTLTAKGLNPDIQIVARAEKSSSMDKLSRAGADKVINPSSLGGNQMVMSMLKPLSVQYVDMMLHSGTKEYAIEELLILEGCELINKTLAESAVRNTYGITIVAIMRGSELMTNPASDVKLIPNDKVVVFGSEDDLSRFERIVNPS